MQNKAINLAITRIITSIKIITMKITIQMEMERIQIVKIVLIL